MGTEVRNICPLTKGKEKELALAVLSVMVMTMHITNRFPRFLHLLPTFLIDAILPNHQLLLSFAEI